MAGDGPPAEPVSPRELEVLDAVARHLTNAEIAAELFISVRTVESHVSSLLRKLGAADRRELARLAPAGPAGPPAPGSGASVPEALAELAGRGAFTGRDAPRRALEGAFDRVVSGDRRHLVVVVGEAGIGKTRLLAETAIGLAGRAGAIAFGRCDPEPLVPYQPFVEALDELAASVPEAPQRRVAPFAGAPAHPPGAAGPAPLDPAAARHQLFEAVEAMLGAAPRPLLLVIDDLHRADRSTLSLLRYLVRGPRRSPLLVAASVRPEGLGAATTLAELLTELEPIEAASQILLGGLSVTDVVELAAHDFPAAAATAGDVWSRTGGNPFLTRELLRHLDETGTATTDALPPPLREIVARRIARLEPRLIHVLSAGALAGESFRFGVAARAAGEDPLDLLGAIDTALLAGFVTEVPSAGDEYRFSHSLVRDALGQRLASSRRLHLHLRLAEELERAGGGDAAAARVAHHRHAALPEGDPRLAADAARRAAAAAMDQVGYEQAAELHGAAADALALLGAPGEQAEQRLARGEALIRAGDRERARTELAGVARMARGAGRPDLLARAALGIGDTAPVWGADDELLGLLGDALAGLGDRDAALRARVRARLALACYYTDRADRRAELSRQAEQDAQASGDGEALAWVLLARHDALWGPGGIDERIATAGRIVELGGRLGHRELQLRGHGLAVTDLLERGDPAGARRAAACHAELAEVLDQPAHRHDAELWCTTWALLDGRFADAVAMSEHALELGRAFGIAAAEELYWVQRFGISFDREEPGDLDELVGEYERLARRHPHVPAWRAALAALGARRDDRAAARAEYELLMAGLATIPRDVVWLNAVTYLADVCEYLGDAAGARVLLAELEPYAGQVAVVDRGLYCKGAVAGYVGRMAAVCGRTAEARRWLEQALARHEAFGAPVLVRRSAEALAALGTA